MLRDYDGSDLPYPTPFTSGLTLPRTRSREARSPSRFGTTPRSRTLSGSAGFEQESRRNKHRFASTGRRRRRHWTEKLADGLRSFIAFLFSNVGIVCLVVGYTFVGSFIFVAIEGSHQPVITVNVSMIRNTTANNLWNMTSKGFAFAEEQWRASVNAVLVLYQGKIVEAIKTDDFDAEHDEKNSKWGYAGAFLYSLTVITTIGYGDTCPKTMWGKVVTIAYAIFGMPLFLLYLSNIGDILARSFKWTYARCCLCRCRKKTRASMHALADDGHSRDISARKNAWQMVRVHPGEHLDTTSLSGSEENSAINSNADDKDEDENDDDDDDDDDQDDDDDPQHITVPLTLCLAIMVGYICGGAQLFSEWESWNFLDGSYFCFVSLSTIGFGDIVPGDKIYAGQGLALSSVFCSMYLMLGMALIAMCFNLMQEEVVAKIHTLTRSITPGYAIMLFVERSGGGKPS